MHRLSASQIKNLTLRGGPDRVYEDIRDDLCGLWAIEARQLSGPELPIVVSEMRTKFWGGGREPEHLSRYQIVGRQIDGKYVPIDEIQGASDVMVGIFKRMGQPGELGYRIPEIGIQVV